MQGNPRRCDPLKEKIKRILICDDRVQLLAVMSELLKLEGFEPVIAQTGKEALDTVAEFSPDLVLLDYRLPDMDGTTLLREIKCLDGGVPIIMMTGFGDKRIAAELIKLGAAGYLVKPFQRTELLRTIEKALRKDGEIQRNEKPGKLPL
jgi:DNA-binding response OmpR family regulator